MYTALLIDFASRFPPRQLEAHLLLLLPVLLRARAGKKKPGLYTKSELTQYLNPPPLNCPYVAICGHT